MEASAAEQEISFPLIFAPISPKKDNFLAFNGLAFLFIYCLHIYTIHTHTHSERERARENRERAVGQEDIALNS